MADVDRTSAEDTTLDLRANSSAKLVSNVDVCINASGISASGSFIIIIF